MKKTILLYAILLLGCTAMAQQTGTLRPGDFIELTDTKPFDGPDVWSRMPQAVRFSWATTDVRYPKRSIPAIQPTARWQTKAWKGERVNAQALLWTKRDIVDATLTVSDLRNGSSVIPAADANAYFMRYVMTDELSKDGKTGCGHRPDKADWDSTAVADMLDILPLRDIPACTTQPVWLTIRVPRDVKAGTYKGTLTVSGKSFAPMTLQVAVDVLNRTLPDPKEWAFHLDFWQNPYAIARYYNVPLWSREHFDAMRPVMQMLADMGQKVITTTIMHKPWAGQTYDHFDSMVGKMKKLDGSWAYDYTVFDQWVEFMMNEIGIDRQISCYTMIPWALSFDYYDQATSRVLYVEAKPGDALYNSYWGSFLKDFARHLKQKGWFDKTVISMDERGLKPMQEAIKVIKDADPAFKISLAGNYHKEIEADLYDYCLAYGQNFTPEEKARREKEGKISTVYTCCSEPLPNFFTFSPPAEAAWTIWHAAGGGYDGYLRWSFNAWTDDPLRDTRFRTWAAGDCFLVYPGPQPGTVRSSMRYERIAEGVQDMEKIRILRAEFAANGQQAKLDKLNQMVARFVPDQLTPDNAAQMVNEARRLLNSF